MTLPASGLITLQDVNVELGKTANAAINLNDADVRSFLGKTAGAVSLSDAYGKTKSSSNSSIIAGNGDWGTGYSNGSYFSATGTPTPNPLTLKNGSPVSLLGSIYDADLGIWILQLITGTPGDITVTINNTPYALIDEFGTGWCWAQVGSRIFTPGTYYTVSFSR